MQSQAHGGGDTQRVDGQRGRYEVRLSDDERDPTKRKARLGFTKPTRELDTVASDLLYYAHKQGIPEDSPTHRLIVRLAGDAYERRRTARNG